ncbi:guanylate kinase [Pelobacter sp. M08fum]|uniref:Guanylate kinase n=1 Tax=Pelovirga terrestris TaxID=2771352 RepID=A0A8J6R4L2_9BACT|nr:guanylate kinase [Pelovirga terrestris]
MGNEDQREGILFVVSAPSGAGKTSLCRELIDTFPEIGQSVSFTTRSMRAGERDGVDYHFVDHLVFERMIAANQFAEWARVHGNLYGTALNTLEQATEQGIDLLLDIDYQGAAQLKKNCTQGVFIFILPPDLSELERRLRSRGTDSDEVIRRRHEVAREEIAQAVWYDYLVVNDDLTSAVDKIKSIVTAERCRSVRSGELLQQIIK